MICNLKKSSFVFLLFSLFMSFAVTAHAAGPGNATCEIRLLDAITTAVEKNSNVRIYKSLEKAAAAGELSAKAQFDPNFKASVNRSSEYTPLSESQKKSYRSMGSPDFTKLRQSLLSYNVNYERRYRSGTLISPSITVSSSETNTPRNDQPYSTAKIQFSLTKPLAQGKNPEVNAVYEKTSRIESEGASLDKLYAVSQVIRGAISSYWNYAYSYKALKIAEGSKKRAEKLYNDTKLLVENFESPAAELDQLVASLNQKDSDCEKASQSLLQSRNELKLAMGLEINSSVVIGPPADFFPVDYIVKNTFETELLIKSLVGMAEANRKDYLAAKKRLESFKFLIPAARDAMKPQLDLQFSAGYSGRKDDKSASAIISSLVNDVPGANVSAIINYTVPIGQKSARAEIIKQEEQFNQAKIKTDEIMRTFIINIQTQANSVASLNSRYKKMVESGRLYEKALQNEKEKNRMGASTLMDIVNIEDRLGQAELALEGAVLEYASAVLNLRFESGCLGNMGTAECEIKMEDIITMPEIKK